MCITWTKSGGNSRCIGSKYRLPALLYTGVADFYGHIMPMVYGHLLFPSLRIYLPVWRGSTYMQRHKENFSQGGGKFLFFSVISIAFSKSKLLNLVHFKHEYEGMLLQR